MIFERGLAAERIFNRGTAIVVVGFRRAVLPVVGIILQVFAPVELLQRVQLAHFNRGVVRFGRRHLGWRQFHLGAHGLGRVAVVVAVGGRLIRLCREAFEADFAAARFGHLEHRILLKFRLHDGLQFWDRELQDLNRLLELGRHHQLLAQPQFLSEFCLECHLNF